MKPEEPKAKKKTKTKRGKSKSSQKGAGSVRSSDVSEKWYLEIKLSINY